MTVEITINGVKAQAEEGDSLLEVIRKYGFEVPSLCHHYAVEACGACRVCLVSVKDNRGEKLAASCNYQVREGLEVTTDSDEIKRNRAMVLELMLAESSAPQIVKLAAEYGVTGSRFAKEGNEAVTDERKDCILCGLCVRVCEEVVEVSALNFVGRGDKRNVGTPYMETPQACIACGSCAYVCPADCIGYYEEDGKRILKKWNRELPMQKDERGRPFAPQFQMFHFTQRAGLPMDFYKKGGPGSR